MKFSWADYVIERILPDLSDIELQRIYDTIQGCIVYRRRKRNKKVGR